MSLQNLTCVHVTRNKPLRTFSYSSVGASPTDHVPSTLVPTWSCKFTHRFRRPDDGPRTAGDINHLYVMPATNLLLVSKAKCSHTKFSKSTYASSTQSESLSVQNRSPSSKQVSQFKSKSLNSKLREQWSIYFQCQRHISLTYRALLDFDTCRLRSTPSHVPSNSTILGRTLQKPRYFIRFLQSHKCPNPYKPALRNQRIYLNDSIYSRTELKNPRLAKSRYSPCTMS